MISKTIGFRGLAYFQTNPHVTCDRALILKGISYDTGALNVTFCPLMDNPSENELSEDEERDKAVLFGSRNSIRANRSFDQFRQDWQCMKLVTIQFLIPI